MPRPGDAPAPRPVVSPSRSIRRGVLPGLTGEAVHQVGAPPDQQLEVRHQVQGVSVER